MMKKKDKHISISFPPIILYVDDVKAIENIIKENCESYRLQTENNKFFSTKELKENNKDTIFELKINAREPYVSIEFSKSDALIFSYDDDEKSVGIVTKTKNIIERRISNLKTFSTIWFWPILAVVIILSFPLIFPGGEYLLWQGILGALTVFVLICGMLLNRKYHSTIYLFKKKKKGSFFY